MPTALRTPRLLLREWCDEDVELFLTHLATTEVTAMLPPLPDRAACATWIGRMRAHNDLHGFAYWAVELPGAAPLIGASGSLASIFLMPLARRWKSAGDWRGRIGARVMPPRRRAPSSRTGSTGSGWRR